jgi:ribosomal protein S6
MGGETFMDKRIYAFETIILFRGDLTASEFDSKATEYRHHVLEGDVLCAEKIPSTIYDIEKIGLKKLAYKT